MGTLFVYSAASVQKSPKIFVKAILKNCLYNLFFLLTLDVKKTKTAHRKHTQTLAALEP